MEELLQGCERTDATPLYGNFSLPAASPTVLLCVHPLLATVTVAATPH